MNKNISKNTLAVALGRCLHWLLGGWSIEGELPRLNKYVIVVAHHTSAWDFVVALGAKLRLGLQLRFFGKHSLFIGPLGWFMRSIGGIPIDRSRSHNRVEQVAEAIRNSENFVLAITPEGTRAKVNAWKTGFYHIAHQTGISVLPVALDFKHKKVVLGSPYFTTGDQSEDIKELHGFFVSYEPRHPELSCNGPLEKQNP